MKSKVDFPGSVIILTNFSTDLKLSPEINDVYNLSGLPYCPAKSCTGKQYKKLTQFNYVLMIKAIKSGCTVILLDTTPIVLQILKEMHEKTRLPDLSKFVVLTFFHEDKYLESKDFLTGIDGPVDPKIFFNSKQEDLERLSKFSFINKIDLPLDHEITPEYLTALYRELQ